LLGNNISLDPDAVAKLDATFSDDIQGGQEMTQYLIGLGHRSIGFVGNLRLPWFARCFEGYRRAMEAAGLTPLSSTIDSEADDEIGYLGTKSLLAQGKAVTAIFAGNDSVAHGVYKALRDCRLHVPQDISVVGCDDMIGTWLFPPLTTIREFPELLGKQMIQMALNRIAEPGLPPQCVTIPIELIKRESCRPIEAPKTSGEGGLLRESLRS
jgi:DNA-binding LacI/PurR family transcriptional regulator